MKETDLISLEATRLLERIRSIPPTPLSTNEYKRNSKQNKSYVSVGKVEGESALSQLDMTHGGDDTIKLESMMKPTRGGGSYNAHGNNYIRSEEDEEHSQDRKEKMRQLKNWANNRSNKIEDLIDAAKQGMQNSVSILTGVRYGAALLSRGGYIFSGCNIESHDSSMNTSAEKMAILKAIGAGETEFECIVLTWDQMESDRFPMPSGSSRQYLSEFGNFDVILVKADEVRTRMETSTYELLPHMPEYQGKRNKTSSPRIGTTTTMQSPLLTSPIKGGVGGGAFSNTKSAFTFSSPRSNSNKLTTRTVSNLPVRDWSVRNVLDWLDIVCDLPSYQYNFQQCSVNGPMLLQLTAQDLEEVVGVHHPIHLSKLKKGIEKLKKREVFEHGAHSNNIDDVVDSLQENELILIARLKESFDTIDSQRNGMLDANQIKSVLHLLGCDLSSQEIHQWIRQYGEESSTLTFPQFVNAFFIMTKNHDLNSDDEQDDGEKRKRQNKKLTVTNDGHVHCRENKNYDKWLRKQQMENGISQLGSNNLLDKTPTLGGNNKSELALWIKQEDQGEESSRIKSFLRDRRKPPSRPVNIGQEIRPEDFARLKRIFDRVDRDQSGELTRHEASRAMCKTGMKVTPVEFGQYMRLQGLDSSCPVDLFEFARAFAYFVKQKEIKLDNFTDKIQINNNNNNIVDIEKSKSKHNPWPVAYDPTGVLTNSQHRRRKRKKNLKRKSNSKRTKRSKKKRSRKHKRPENDDSSSSSDFDSSSSSSFSSSSSSSSSDSSSSDNSESSSSSYESDSSFSSNGFKNIKHKKRKPIKIKGHVVKKVENAFKTSKRLTSRKEIPVNYVHDVLMSIPRSRNSKDIPSNVVLTDYLTSKGIHYYVNKKQFLELYAHLAYDSEDEDYMPKKQKKKRFTNSDSSDDSDGDDEAWNVGDQVEARFRGKLKWEKGEITKRNADGTYNILYNDGDMEKGVRPSLIRKLRRRSQTSSDDSSDDDQSIDEAPIFRGDKVEAKYKNGRKWFKGKIVRVVGDGTYDISYEDGDKERGVPRENIKTLSSSSNESSSSSSESDNNNKFEEGDKVKAKYKNGTKYYDGTIMKVNSDGSYAIQYDDGDFEKRVKPQLIKGSPTRKSKEKKSRKGTSSFRVGQTVEGNYKQKGKWYKGKITRKNSDGSFDIKYNDGDSERGVSKRYIKSLESSLNSSDSENETRFSLGDRVEGKFKGGKKWFKGKICRVNRNGTFDIDYDDGDHERGVETKNIRKLSSSSRSPRSRRKTFSSDESEDDTSDLDVGDKVEALYKNGKKYYKGKITKRNGNGTFDIHYDDGDRERYVVKSKIKKLSAGDNISLGTRVEAKYKGGSKWYKGKVTKENRDGTYDLVYDDGDRERGVIKENIRSLEKNTKTKKQKKNSFSDSDDESEDDGFSIGNKVEAKYKNGSKWYKGKITNVNRDGSCDIDYDDGDRERRVPTKNIRKLGGRSKSPTKRKSATTLQVGSRVEAKFKNGRKWYKGKITRENRDGTYDISYDDGDRERGVSTDIIRSLENNTSSSDDDSGGFSIGDKVEAKFKNGTKWYKGRITKVNRDGSCDIDYDDGDKERRVHPSKIKKLEKTKTRVFSDDDTSNDNEEIGLGDRVEAKYKRGHKWYKGKITRANSDGTFDIVYDDGDKERRVKRDLIRLLGSNKASPRSKSPTKRKSTTLRVGSRVEAKFKNGRKWYKGKITRENRDGTYDISYDDGDRERGVSTDIIRPLETSSSDDDNEDDHDDGGFSIGDKVEAKFKNGSKWYKGRITKVNRDGSCDIDYDDGDKERRVPPRIICKMGGRSKSPTKRKSTTLRVGSRVEAKFKNGRKWYKGKITRENRDGTYDISYDDGDRERGVSTDIIRPLENNNVITTSSSSDDDNNGGFSIGDKVEAKFKNGTKWYKGRITKVNRDGSCDIDYDDGDKERRVPPRIIRKLGGRSKSPTKRKSDTTLQVGSRVEAKFKNGRKWYKGKITRENRDGTYDISYDDGDRERGVSTDIIRPLGNNVITTSSSDDDNGGFSIGEKVEAKFKNGTKWYKGRITKVNRDGSCDIDYDDGDKERRVPPRIIRKLAKKTTMFSDEEDDDDDNKTFMVDDRVEAKYKNGRKWYKGNITKVNRDGSCDINYDDGDSERRVPPNLVRKLDDSVGKRSTSRKRFMDEEEDDSEENIRIGTKVEAKYKGGLKWYKGVITKQNRDGSYDIDYDDGDQERRVPARSVRKLNNSKTRFGGGNSDVDEEEIGFRVGDKIEALYKNGSKWYKGKISRKNRDGTYDIAYDDGDREQRVRSNKIRKTKSTKFSENTSSSDDEGDFNVGDRVEAKFKNGSKWYKGEITRKNADGSFAIDYDDGDKERRVPKRIIRKLSSSPRSMRSPSSSPRGTAARSSPRLGSGNFKVGDRVEGQFKRKPKWYKGKIKRDNRDGTYDILYDDGDRDVGLESEYIRLLESSSPRKKTTFAQDDISNSPTRRSGGGRNVKYAQDY